MDVTSTPTRPQSLVELAYRQKLLVVAALCVSLFVTTAAQTVVATAAQNIVADIGGFDRFTWLFAGFSLAAAVAVPIVGKLSDIVGRKQVIIGSMGLFVAASAAAGLSQTMTQLIVIRGFQGIGFAGSMGSVWIIMAALWPPEDRAKWMGVTSAGFTLSGILGPIIGGVISDAGSWRWLFIMNVPAGGLAILLLMIWMPSIKENRRRPRFDLSGTAAFALFSSAALLAISIGGNAVPWLSPTIGLLALITAGGIFGFVLIERKAVDPLIPLELFRARVFSASMVASLGVVVNFIVITAFLPLFIQGVKGESATTSAIPLMFMALGTAVGANVSGQLQSRFNRPREGAVFGLSVNASIMFWFSTIDPDISISQLSVAMVILGVGLTFTWTSFTAPIQNAMPGRVLGVVTSSLQFGRMFGMAAGAAAFGAILAAQLSANLGADLAGPAAAFSDPELLVADERLADVRDEFLADAALGQAAFDASLVSARESLADALVLVFRIASTVAMVCIPLSLIAFHRYRIYPDDD